MNNWGSICLGLLLSFTCTGISAAYVVPRHISPSSLDQNTRQLFEQSMYWDEHFFDPKVALVRSPYNAIAGAHANPNGYMVRESSWYALGLLFRDAAGDRERAANIVNAVLKEQYLKPGVRWYGTYKRTPEEPDPTEKSVIWRGYDPNWRVFIGTTFAMMLIEYPDRIPAELTQKMYAAIDRSIEGEMAEGRLVSSYTNIALMYGFLWDFAAVHDNRDDWKKQSAEWTESVYRLYKQFGAFSEYNSPTYCGVDIYGLALWRDYGSTQRIRAIGSEMEAGLWRDLASYYQPDLRNLSGPFDRAYGMDMEEYVSVVGVWMRTVLDAPHAPLPVLTATTDHLPDLWFAPHIAILGTSIPADALAKMRSFSGGHLVSKRISEQRVATAWLGRGAIFGGESTSKTRDVGSTSQFHPATVQWRTPSGEIGWVQLTESPMIDVTADEHGLTISASGTVRLRIHAKDLVQNKLGAKRLEMPGLSIDVDSDTKDFKVEQVPSGVDLIYAGMNRMRLNVSTAH